MSGESECLVSQSVGESVCLNGESVCLHSESLCLVSQRVGFQCFLVSQRVGESVCLNCESMCFMVRQRVRTGESVCLWVSMINVIIN